MSRFTVSIIVPGRLHAFDMALYFQQQGVLNELVTGYPKKYVTPFGIEKKYIKSLYVNEIINRTTNKLGLGYPLDGLACDAFDWLAARTIKFDSDVYFIWSGYGEFTIKQLRNKNPKAKVIIVRGSTHIVTHNQFLKKINNSIKNIISNRIIAKEQSEYQLADYITVPSTFAKQTFLDQRVESEKLFLNYLGVSLKEFPYNRKTQINPNKLVFGNVGNLSMQKNVAAIINVMEKIYETNKNIHLVLAGAIEQQTFPATLLDRPFITYKGKVPQAELNKIYKEIDVFVINSVQEGMAMVQLQAMSSGCPIISTINAGASDLINDYENGIAIPAFDNITLRKAMEWFIENKHAILPMGIKSRQKTENGFTWDDFGKRNMEFIQKILNK